MLTTMSSSLYNFENTDFNDIKNYSIFYEDGSIESSLHCFSKSYPCKLIIDNKPYLSVQHYMQSQKFKNTNSKIYKQILTVSTTKQANLLAVQNGDSVDKNFLDNRKKIYYKGTKKKFQQHNELKQILLETKQKPIICISNDTFFGLLRNKNNKQKLNGDNIAGILLTKIRDEMLLNDSDCDDDELYDDDQLNNNDNNDQKDDVKTNDNENQLIKGDVKKKFNMTYSAIFAPFLVSVVVRLLNNSSSNLRVNLHHYVNDWGGGIKIIRKCCIQHQLDPKDKNVNWDVLIDLCCIATPITHNAWIRLLKYNKLKVTNDPIENLKTLLKKWKRNGEYNRMYGTYPTAREQEFYIQDTIPREISEILNYAIINDVFKNAFEEMNKIPRPEPTIGQQATSFVGYLFDLWDKTINDITSIR